MFPPHQRSHRKRFQSAAGFGSADRICDKKRNGKKLRNCFSGSRSTIIMDKKPARNDDKNASMMSSNFRATPTLTHIRSDAFLLTRWKAEICCAPGLPVIDPLNMSLILHLIYSNVITHLNYIFSYNLMYTQELVGDHLNSIHLWFMTWLTVDSPDRGWRLKRQWTSSKWRAGTSRGFPFDRWWVNTQTHSTRSLASARWRSAGAIFLLLFSCVSLFFRDRPGTTNKYGFALWIWFVHSIVGPRRIHLIKLN